MLRIFEDLFLRLFDHHFVRKPVLQVIEPDHCNVVSSPVNKNSRKWLQGVGETIRMCSECAPVWCYKHHLKWWYYKWWGWWNYPWCWEHVRLLDYGTFMTIICTWPVGCILKIGALFSSFFTCIVAIVQRLFLIAVLLSWLIALPFSVLHFLYVFGLMPLDSMAHRGQNWFSMCIIVLIVKITCNTKQLNIGNWLVGVFLRYIDTIFWHTASLGPISQCG